MEFEAISPILKQTATIEVQEDHLTIPFSTEFDKAEGDRFSQILNSSDQETIYSIQTPQVPVSVFFSEASLGDAILHRLDSLGASFKEKLDQVYEMLKVPPGEYSFQDMLKLQYHMAVVSTEIEIVGKGVQKAVQHVDQLSKLQ